jgi:hypothetical protein
MYKARIFGLAVILFAITMAGCAGGPLSTRERYTLGGGAVGAATGALLGGVAGNAAMGAAIGGPVGLIGGYLIGDSLQGGGYGSSSSYGGTCPRRTTARTPEYEVRGYSRKTSTGAASSNNSNSGSRKPGGAGEVF